MKLLVDLFWLNPVLKIVLVLKRASFLTLLFFFFSPFATLHSQDTITIFFQDTCEETPGVYWVLIRESTTPESMSVDSFIAMPTSIKGLTGPFWPRFETLKGTSNILLVDKHDGTFDIAVDANSDSVFEEAETVPIKLNDVIKAFFHYKDDKGILKIPCTLHLTKTSNSLFLQSGFSNYCTTSYEKDGRETTLRFRKWGSWNLDLLLDGKKHVPFGDPIRIGKSFYRIHEFDYVANKMILNKVDPEELLVGVSQGFYLDSLPLKEAFDAHNLSSLGKNLTRKKQIFYFWGPWCHPCMSSIEETQRFLNSLPKDSFDVINICLLNEKGETDEVLDLVTQYSIQNSCLEFSIDSKIFMPFIFAFDNQSYPNYIVLDEQHKIIFRDNESKLYKLKAFLGR